MKEKTPITKEEIVEFLESLGIKTELINADSIGWSREVKFTIYDTTYIIEWYHNQSTLHIGEHQRSARILFKYMFFDNTYPLIGGNRSIAFSYIALERNSIFDKLYPYEVFRIPIEPTQP
jgi:hypothetical protein